MKNIKLYYFDGMPNFGDMLNVEICRKLFNINPVSTSPKCCEASFIGSLLDDFLYDRKSILNLKFFKRKFLQPPVNVWGSGFICDKDQYIKKRIDKPEVFFRRINVHAVRGMLSLNRLKKITGKKLEKAVVADPGLLAEKLIPICKVEKKYKIGIIPHHIEIHGYHARSVNYACQSGLLPKDLVLDVNCYDKIKRNIDEAVFIDMEANVLDCLQRIAECELIASASLHGLIVADSMNIPNLRILASDRLIGGDYKFCDYYSVYKTDRRRSFNLIDASDKDVMELPHFITDEYIEARDEIDVLKEKLMDSFPYRSK